MKKRFATPAWLKLELSLEYFHTIGYVAFEIPKAVSLSVIVAVFVAAYFYARAKGPVERSLDPLEKHATELLASEQPNVPKNR